MSLDLNKVKMLIPAAGSGTRMIPVSAFFPKEFLPVPYKGFAVPAILALIWSGLEAGIPQENIKIVVSADKREKFREVFSDRYNELIAELQAKKGKEKFAEQLLAIPKINYEDLILQVGPYGNGTPLISAYRQINSDSALTLASNILENPTKDILEIFEKYKNSLIRHHIADDEWILYALPDDLFLTENGAPNDIAQMLEAADKYDASILATKLVEEDWEYDSYGIVSGESISGTSGKAIIVKTIIEKPGKENAPSVYASVSAFLFKPGFMKYMIEELEGFSGEGEFMFQPAIQRAIDTGEKFVAQKINGEYHDAGNYGGYAKLWASAYQRLR